jgi:hypothetical protein
MPIVDRSKLSPEILKFIDDRQEARSAGTTEFLESDEAKGFDLQAYFATKLILLIH